MTRFRVIFITAVFLLVGSILFANGTTEEVDYMTFEGSHDDVWKLEARSPLLIGGYGDNFVYDGNAVVPLVGTAMVDVNAKTNEGSLIAEFTGTITPEAGVSYTGDIRIEYTVFGEGSDFWEGGIADFVLQYPAFRFPASPIPVSVFSGHHAAACIRYSLSFRSVWRFHPGAYRISSER